MSEKLEQLLKILEQLQEGQSSLTVKAIFYEIFHELYNLETPDVGLKKYKTQLIEFIDASINAEILRSSKISRHDLEKIHDHIDHIDRFSAKLLFAQKSSSTKKNSSSKKSEPVDLFDQVKDGVFSLWDDVSKEISKTVPKITRFVDDGTKSLDSLGTKISSKASSIANGAVELINNGAKPLSALGTEISSRLKTAKDSTTRQVNEVVEDVKNLWKGSAEDDRAQNSKNIKTTPDRVNARWDEISDTDKKSAAAYDDIINIEDDKRPNIQVDSDPEVKTVSTKLPPRLSTEVIKCIKSLELTKYGGYRYEDLINKLNERGIQIVSTHDLSIDPGHTKFLSHHDVIHNLWQAGFTIYQAGDIPNFDQKNYQYVCFISNKAIDDYTVQLLKLNTNTSVCTPEQVIMAEIAAGNITTRQGIKNALLNYGVKSDAIDAKTNFIVHKLCIYELDGVIHLPPEQSHKLAQIKPKPYKALEHFYYEQTGRQQATTFREIQTFFAGYDVCLTDTDCEGIYDALQKLDTSKITILAKSGPRYSSEVIKLLKKLAENGLDNYNLLIRKLEEKGIKVLHEVEFKKHQNHLNLISHHDLIHNLWAAGYSVDLDQASGLNSLDTTTIEKLRVVPKTPIEQYVKSLIEQGSGTPEQIRDRVIVDLVATGKVKYDARLIQVVLNDCYGYKLTYSEVLTLTRKLGIYKLGGVFRLPAGFEDYRVNLNLEEFERKLYKVTSQTTKLNAGLSAFIPTKVQQKFDTLPGFFYDSEQTPLVMRGYHYLKTQAKEVKNLSATIIYTRAPQLHPMILQANADAASRYLMVFNLAGVKVTDFLIHQNQAVNNLADRYQDSNFVSYGLCKIVRDTDNMVTMVGVPVAEGVIYVTTVPAQLDHWAYGEWRHFLHGGGADAVLGEDGGQFMHALACLDWASMRDSWIKIQGHDPKWLRRTYETSYEQFLKRYSQYPVVSEKNWMTKDISQTIVLGETAMKSPAVSNGDRVPLFFLDPYVNHDFFDQKTQEKIPSQLSESQKQMVELGILSPTQPTPEVTTPYQLTLKSWVKPDSTGPLAVVKK